MPTKCSTKVLAHWACALCVQGVARDRVPRPGRDTALGCTGRTGVRVLALSVRRVDPVAGLELTAAGASRHDASTILLQKAARDEARLYTCEHARRRRARVKNHPDAQARRGGLPHGLAGRRPCTEHARACAGHSRA
jgi:hypothetical protein